MNACLSVQYIAGSYLHNFVLHFKITNASRSVSHIEHDGVESVVQKVYRPKVYEINFWFTLRPVSLIQKTKAKVMEWSNSLTSLHV